MIIAEVKLGESGELVKYAGGQPRELVAGEIQKGERRKPVEASIWQARDAVAAKAQAGQAQPSQLVECATRQTGYLVVAQIKDGDSP